MKTFLIILTICLTVNIQAQSNSAGYVFIQRDTIPDDTFPNFNHWEMYRMYNCSKSDMGLLEKYKAGNPRIVLFKLLSMEDSTYHGKTKVGVGIRNGAVNIDSVENIINLKCENQSKIRNFYSFQIPKNEHAILANLDIDNNRLVLNFYDYEAMKLGKIPPVLKQMVVNVNTNLLCPL